MKLVFILLVLFSCGNAVAIDEDDGKIADEELTPVTLQLKWKHQFQFAGFYAAIQQGYYKEVGLKVTLKELQADVNVVAEVVSGRAEYGISDSSLVIDRYRGSPVVLLSNIFQHSPMVLVAKSGSGIISPAQIVGKRLMISKGEQVHAALVAMLGRESVSLDQVDIVDHSFSIDDFIAGKVDVLSAYASNELAEFERRGIAVNIIDPLNYGVDLYGNNIFTSANELAQHPLRVQKFIAASLKGWAYALDHSGEIIDLILSQYTVEKSRESLRFEANKLRKYIVPQHIPLGTIDRGRIERIVDSYRDLGLMQGGFDVDAFIYQDSCNQRGNVAYSDEELAWIKQHPVLTLGVDKNWLPFEGMSEEGEYQGMSADFIRLVAKRVGFGLKVQAYDSWTSALDDAKRHRLDILPAVMKSQQKESYLDFTRPYVSYPMVIVRSNNARILSGLDDVQDERVVVVKGYATEDLLRINHPSIDLVTEDTIEQAIDLVLTDENYALVGNLVVISQVISKRGVTNLNISGTTRYSYALSMAVSKGNDILLRVLQKALDSLTREEIQQIKRKWIFAQRPLVVDYSMVFLVLTIAALVVMVIAAWNRRLSQEVGNRKQAESRAQESERRFRSLFEENKAIELLVDPANCQIVEANKAAVDFYGYSHDYMRGFSMDKIHQHSKQEIDTEIQLAQTEHRSHLYFKHRLASGEIRDVQVQSGAVQWDDRELVYSIIHDVTAEKRLQQEVLEKNKNLAYQATHDALTGLANRREFEARLSQIIRNCKTQPKYCFSSLVYMDLDHFKVVNDTAGHAAGDELLIKVSKLIKQLIPENDTFARIGGDEFGLLLKNCSAEQAVDVVQLVIREVKNFQFIWDNTNFRIGISAGITEIRNDQKDIDEVLSQVDAACYAAKKQGRNLYHVFREDDEELIRRKGEMWWTNEIIRATEDNRLILYRQDIVHIGKHQDPPGEHYEILLRMLNEDGELIAPDHFLPAAERYKLMLMIDRWVIRTLFDWLKANPKHVEDLYQCSVNLSGHSISDITFHAFLIDRLKESGVPPEKICWEITETAAIANFKDAQNFINMVRAMGCSFSLDDFGSGLSSYSYIKHLKADYLKIDGGFIADILTDPNDQLIVESIHQVSTGLGMKTVAEFVENEQVLDKLKEIGIDYAQGYGLAKPEPLSRETKV